MSDAFIVQVTLVLALVLFVIDKIRYDMVALLSLFALVLVGIVPVDETFSGFGNPAVVTVVAVLVLSRGLEKAGISAWLGKIVAHGGKSPSAQVGSLSTVVAVASAFINNIGALALLLPSAIEMARKARRSPSIVLMPMAFASVLGGTLTLIGTPPNIIISNFRKQATGETFSFFDFSPVGIGVVIAGILYISLIGWRLLPKRAGGDDGNLFEIDGYFTEVQVPQNSTIEGQTVNDIMKEDDEVHVMTIRRGKEVYSSRLKSIVLRTGDVLVVRADSQTLAQFITASGVKLTGEKLDEHDFDSSEMEAVEAVVMAGANIEGSSAHRMDLRRLFSINLLALARKGNMIASRLKNERIRAGDVLLMQVPRHNIRSNLSRLGMLPLAKRDLKLPGIPKLVTATLIFGSAIMVTSLGYLPSSVAFALAATAMILLSVLSVREAYEAIDWPIVVLLGAMIPVGTAFETSGAAFALAEMLAGIELLQDPTLMLIALLVATMLLSDILNNAAAAIIMCPVAINLAKALQVSTDTYLMATAIGVSCAFLTPIGHQSNTLVLGPGGYKFGDYFRMGILLEILVVAVSVPLLLYFWPLRP